MCNCLFMSLSSKSSVWVSSGSFYWLLSPLCYGQTFLFLCTSCNFLLKTGHLKYYNVADLKARFSSSPGFIVASIVIAAAAIYVVTFLNKFCKVCILYHAWPWDLYVCRKPSCHHCNNDWTVNSFNAWSQSFELLPGGCVPACWGMPSAPAGSLQLFCSL